MKTKRHYTRGYTIFFATLVSSLALAIGLSIYDLTVRTLSLSGITSQSQYAIYAADTGAECALYWDSKHPTAGSIFATSSGSTLAIGASGAYCNGTDVTVGATRAYVGSSATTTFTMQFSAQSFNSTTLAPCATIEVGKHKDSEDRMHTVILSHGYNTCANVSNRVERILRVTY